MPEADLHGVSAALVSDLEHDPIMPERHRPERPCRFARRLEGCFQAEMA